ncbi:hypothetical protein Tco_0029269, partial [Tanacetum coccineum]
ANNGLLKKFALLDSAHSSCSGKEMELLDRPKDMIRGRLPRNSQRLRFHLLGKVVDCYDDELELAGDL